MTISILIPVNNYDIVALIDSLKSGMEKVPEFSEIIIGDDGSSEDFRAKYMSLTCGKVKLVISETNIGRAAIRNRMIQKAEGDFYLFIDADAMIPGTAEAFFNRCLGSINSAKVICGGILYSDTPPGDPDKSLRWKYGRKEEQKNAADRNKNPYAFFSTFNVLMSKTVFAKLRFYEELKQYGHEDTLLGYQMKKAGIGVLHIDNGLVHEGLEDNREFLAKTKLGIENLSRLFDVVTDRKTFSSIVTVLWHYRIIRLLQVSKIFAALFIRYRERMERRLDSSDVPLRIFQLYKISMFCTYREIHERRSVFHLFRFPDNI